MHAYSSAREAFLSESKGLIPGWHGNVDYSFPQDGDTREVGPVSDVDGTSNWCNRFRTRLRQQKRPCMTKNWGARVSVLRNGKY